MADPRPGDPADRAVDAKADGAFGGLTNHRGGYGGIEFEGQTYTKLQWVERTARIGGTLAAGEGRMLLAEIDRQRRILAALREPSETIVAASTSAWHLKNQHVVWAMEDAIRAAVAAAEQEVGP